MTGQTKLQSLIEVTVSTAFGFLLAFFAQLLIMHLYDLPHDPIRDLYITAYFTAISLARGYAVRRFFNWFHLRQARG